LRKIEWRLDMQTTRIALAMLGALVTPFALSALPKKLPPWPLPLTTPAGTALLAPGHRLGGASLPNEYAYSPAMGWRRIVAPPVPDWSGVPTALAGFGPWGGTPALELGWASRASSDGEDGVEHHPVRDEGPITHSGFDDEDRVDHHPVRDKRPITHSDFDDEDRVDHHPVP
jgi:hypothetical protein